MAMQQLQQLAGVNEQQILLGKRLSALELTRIENEIAVAKARAAAADAEIRKQQVEMRLFKASESETTAAYFTALIDAATTQRDAYLAEAAALETIFETKRQMAELTLSMDPQAMSKVIGALGTGILGDDPDNG